MARKVIYQLVDDLDGTELEIGEGETIRFSIDGNDYEIDLSNDHAKLFRAATKKYVDSARVPDKDKPKRRGSGRAAGPKRDLASVRAWAARNGHQVSTRGRIPYAIVDAYDAAMGN